MRFIGLLILTLTGAAIGVAGVVREPEDVVHTFLATRAGFSASDIAAISGGRAMVRLRNTSTSEEIAMDGGVRIDAPADAFIARVRDITAFENGSSVLQTGKLQTPPVLGDFKALTLDADELDAARQCKPKDCGLQLGSAAMERFRTGVQWNTSTAGEQANAVEREMLLDLYTRYATGGTVALGTFDDHEKPISVRHEFDALLASAPAPPADIPGLLPYLREDAPLKSLPNAEQFFYWAKFAFGMKPTIRLNHVTIYPLTGRADGLRYVIATKQVYASHYFSATLELRYLVEDHARPGGFYLLCSTQSRSHGFTGLWGSIVKIAVKRGARSGMEKYLQSTKRNIEAR